MRQPLCHPLSLKVKYENYFLENALPSQVQIANKMPTASFPSTFSYWGQSGLITKGKVNCFFFWFVGSSSMYQIVLIWKTLSRFLVVLTIFSWKRYKNHCEKLYLFNTKGSKNTVINSKSSCQGLYLLLVSLPVQCTGIAMNCDCHESLLSKYCWTSGHCHCHGFILLKCLQWS